MQNDSHLHFSVEEQVWLKKGQEVEEVLSISLDPEISIEEYEDYVAVKGCLYLSGEYLQRENDGSEDEENDSSVYRSVHEVETREDGTATIGHRFPVDITIPASRIRKLEDIYVTVDTFDYTLCETNCLQLNADISISGIQGDASYSAYENDSEVEYDEVMEEERSSDESVWETDVKYVNNEADEPDMFPANVRTPQVDMRAQPPEQHVEHVQHEEVQDEADNETNYDLLTRMAGQSSEASYYNHNEESAQRAYGYGYEPQIEQEEVEEENVEEREPIREENALYLTNMLTKDEENFSKMKMCIIQPGDSLTEIAERYRVLPSHLARVNRLDEEEVREGQILYIPVNR
ncbi:stage VI sporulation protein D [Guptibacillus algicola]|uniref:stage VI sporulation protein D n=1 Tax=Guptibacillus algicola TaxID=225844 RepID=UPI001CD7171B|nr:stage VI sporulation protein D [Alkalihalobacillus algicola]MCA0986239.1 stage VI sporulation protein D [Alkalihalobacillus algicola]